MRSPDRWKRAILKTLTRLWVWFYYRSAIERDTVQTWSEEQEVYRFSSDSDLRGQAIPFIGTIILNEQKLAGCSDDELKFVLEHEIGHKLRNPIVRGLIYGLVLFWIPLGIWLLVKALGYSLLIPFGLSIIPVAKLAGGALLMIGAGIVAWRSEEILADFHVLKYVTYEEYLSIYDEVRDDEERTVMSTILLKLVYTKPETIVRLHQTFEQIRNRMFVI